MTETAKTRASRDSETHDKKARRRPWRPVRKLETPPSPPGYTYRWIRESMLGQEDRANVSSKVQGRLGAGKRTDLPPEWELPTMDSGRHAGVIYNEGIYCWRKFLTKRLKSETLIITIRTKRLVTHWITQCSTKPVAIHVTLSMILSETPHVTFGRR